MQREQRLETGVKIPEQINRITVVQKVYHQSAGRSPKDFDVNFSHMLTTDEQPYERYLNVNESWMEIDLGWCKDNSSMLLLYNEPMHFQVKPTEKEKALFDSKHLLISMRGDEEIDMTILPGEDARFHPAQIKKIKIKSAFENLRLRIVVMPS